MRMSWLAFGVVAVLGSAWPSLAAAAPGSGEPAARSANSWSFELFGTRFCTDSGPSCDVTLAPEIMALAVVPALGDARTSLKVFGMTLCLHVGKTGPACDVEWRTPVSYSAWRDWPEIRVAADLDR